MSEGAGFWWRSPATGHFLLHCWYFVGGNSLEIGLKSRGRSPRRLYRHVKLTRQPEWHWDKKVLRTPPVGWSHASLLEGLLDFLEGDAEDGFGDRADGVRAAVEVDGVGDVGD